MWKTDKNNLYQKFEFESFEAAVEFINKVADKASELDHHPKIVNVYSTVELWLTTHSAGNKITQKDKQLARKIDEIIKDESKINSKKSAKTNGAVKLFCDGGSRGNPGHSAAGYLICNLDDSVVKKHKKYLGIATNNQAEYRALLLGLGECQKLKIQNVEVYMDSLLIVNQLKGIFKIKNQDLKILYDKIKAVEKAFDSIAYSYIPRELNAPADALVNEALDEHLA